MHHLYGPLKITAPHKTIAPESGSGFFVFEVTRVVPGRRTPFAKVREAIAQAMTKQRKEHVLAGFVRAFRRRWTARTDCKPGYIVENCKQYRQAKTGPEDPFTL